METSFAVSALWKILFARESVAEVKFTWSGFFSRVGWLIFLFFLDSSLKEGG